MRASASVFALLAALGASNAPAQSRGAVAAAPADTQVEEVVVTGAPFAVSLNSVTTHIDVITQAQLDTAPLGGIGDVLSQTPGVRSSFYGPGASRPVIRGLSGARVLVLQNGVGMVDASTLSPDHAVASDPGQATRIEVLRGPSALAYGGSGVGGVVNVIDERIPTSRPHGPIDGRVSASVQSGDDARALSGHVKTGQGPWVITATGSVRRSGDYHVPAPPVSERYAAVNNVTPLDDDVVRNSSVDVEAYGAGVSYVKENGGFLGLGVNRTETRYGIPFAQIAEPPDPGDEGPVQIHLHQTRYDLRGETPLDLTLVERARFSLGYADYKHAEQLVDTGEVGTTFISHGVEGRAELVQRESETHKGAVGVQGVHRTFAAIGDEAFVPPTDIDDGGVFTLQRWDYGRWGADAGLRLDYAKLDSTVGERDFTNLSGSAGVFYRPNEPLFLALSGSYTGRAPTEFELFANGPHPGAGGFELGDATLDSERVLNVEGTARYTSGPLKLEGHLYYAHYAGYIDERGTADFEDGLRVFRFIQTDADFTGFEGEASYRLWDGGDRNLTAEADYDIVHASTPDGPPARIPPYAVTGRLIYATARTRSEVEVRHLGEQDRVTPFELPTDAYTLINASFEARPFHDESIKLFADGRNLNDAEAREHTSFLKEFAPLPGREMRLGVAYDF